MSLRLPKAKPPGPDGNPPPARFRDDLLAGWWERIKRKDERIAELEAELQQCRDYIRRGQDEHPSPHYLKRHKIKPNSRGGYTVMVND